MKTKTSLTLSEQLIATLDKLAGPKVSRSAYIEKICENLSFVVLRPGITLDRSPQSTAMRLISTLK